MENRVTYGVLKSLTYKRKIFIKQYKDLTLSGSKPGIMYGLAEVQKVVTDGLPIFRPILSAIAATTCKLAKFLVPMLTTNECTIQDSFTFAKELQSFDSKLVMASLAIDSLSTFLCKKQLTSILKNYLNIGLMLIICRTTLSVSCLLGPCLNH